MIFILGPTAIGKTEIALPLAQRINAEIVSLDSRQLYRQMNIGTAKPTLAQRETIPHHVIDCVDIDQQFTVADYQRRFDKSLAEIRERHRRALVVGGAGLYFRAVVDGLFPGPSADFAIRERLRQEADGHGALALHERLHQCDPESAARIHPNNTVRVIRALEVFELTGKPISALQVQWKHPAPRYEFRSFGLDMPREQLYDRIETRADRMMAIGLIEEVKGIIDAGYPSDCVALSSFGYKEIIDYLNGQLTLFEAVALLKQNTRRFAKRQLTWFRSDTRIEWRDLSLFSSIEDIVDDLVETSNGKTLR
ncbi:MAG: tRNA (adenosine(37)-N6)-dimethylallyltransferase MiaA [Candidatus Poribacteria bacterium]|nr:tRNA (adenosine(37)-N6)-dimethylallyltransferase MiaA [Candidatus Poribacteria bacterium]MDE0506890.1 tRNA (adenosine(37)-N6)-dimethylallyltransferase MiaA [Candidatus Poribacteria bacterium]